MKPDLPFHDQNNQPLPGGLCYMVTEKGQMTDSFSCGSRTANLGDTIDWDTSFRMASVSKQYTAAAALLCLQQNKLQLSDTISKYFPYIPNGLVDVTILQLLTHASGITDYETLISPDQKEQLSDRDVLLSIEKNGSLYFPPGTRFRYSNTGYCLLTQIIEKVNKISYSEFMDRYIFKLNNLLNTSVFEKGKKIPHRAYGFKHKDNRAFRADQNIMSATQGDGGIYTSPLAYAQWIEKLFSGKIIADYSQRLFNDTKVTVKDNVFYNMGWFISEEKDGTLCIFHSGESTGFRNMVYYNPDKRKLVLLFSNMEGQEKVMEELFDSLCRSHQLEYGLPLPIMTWLSNVYNP